MILANIIAALKADNTLHSYIADRIYPNVANEEDIPCIVYIFNPLADDQKRRTDILEIRIISKNYELLHNIDQRVRQLLLCTGDTEGIEGILESKITEGNSVYRANTQDNQITTYYTIISKSGI